MSSPEFDQYMKMTLLTSSIYASDVLSIQVLFHQRNHCVLHIPLLIYLTPRLDRASGCYPRVLPGCLPWDLSSQHSCASVLHCNSQSPSQECIDGIANKPNAQNWQATHDFSAVAASKAAVSLPFIQAFAICELGFIKDSGQARVGSGSGQTAML